MAAVIVVAMGLGRVDAGRSGAGDAVAVAAQPRPPKAETIALAWAGVITPGSVYGLLPGDGRSLYAGLRDGLNGHDLAIGNLEGTLGDAGTPKCAIGSRTASPSRPPRAPPAGCAGQGFDVMNVANNHGFDYGANAQLSTITALDDARIKTAGLPGRIQVLRRRGARIAVVGFSTYRWTTSMLDHDAVDTLVRRSNALADVVVVIMHAGAEGSDRSITLNGPEQYLREQRVTSAPSPGAQSTWEPTRSSARAPTSCAAWRSTATG